MLSDKDFLSIGWEQIWNSGYMTSQAKLNKNLRNLGYDAIFDDTKSIHSAEVQLVVLDPRNVKVIERVDSSGSGYKEIVMVMDHIVKMAKEQGYKVIVEKPKLKKGDWGGEKALKGVVDIKDGEKYLYLEVYPNFPDMGRHKRKVGPTGIHVSKMYSNPDLGYGAGAEYKFKDKSFDDIDHEISQLLKKVFQKS